MSNTDKQKKHPLLIVGMVLMIVGVLLSMSNMQAHGPVSEFLTAALPWVLLGLGTACTLTGAFAGQKKGS